MTPSKSVKPYTLHPIPHTPHPTPCPHEKLFQQTLNSNFSSSSGAESPIILKSATKIQLRPDSSIILDRITRLWKGKGIARAGRWPNAIIQSQG
ncbi:hypothetical protein ED562_06330 [Microcystis aeruginosa FACHB-524]|nr:hypothetical protein ED562_06330 [Microcystis aeruginosa FACHB-524]